MDMTLVFLFLFLILIVLVLVSPAFLSRIRRAEEKSRTPLFEEWCAVHRDSGSGSSLGRNLFLWRVSVYPEFMVLGLFSQDLIPYADIEKVEMKDFQTSKEIWLQRRTEQSGELIAIKSQKAERLAEVFAELGVRFYGAPVQSKKNF